MAGRHPEPSTRRRQLGAELRRLRDAAGLTHEQVASRLGWDQPKVSRIENARHGVRPADVTALCDLYQVRDSTLIDFLTELARTADKRGWWQQYEVLAAHDADFISLETDASGLDCYANGTIPVHLRTAAYAREIIAATHASLPPEQVNALVEVLQARQALLTRPEPPRLRVVLHEAILHVRMLSRQDVMRDQLRRLGELAELPNVSIRVLPLDAPPHPGLAGAFTIIGFPLPAFDLVATADLVKVSYLEQQDVVRAYRTAFDAITAAALPPEASIELITKLAGGYHDM
jgi:transcriptional regulator with XRE-family HTH domain